MEGIIGKMTCAFNKMLGLILVEVRKSSLNNCPESEDPRHRPPDENGYIIGEVSPVSVKRKLRDLVEARSPVFMEACSRLNLEPERFQISISEGRDLASQGRQVTDGTFLTNNWDARVFGTTFLQKGNRFKPTGPVQFGVGFSLAPITISRMTFTGKAAVQEDKDRSMAPDGFRVVDWGLYAVPIFTNPSMADSTKCTATDIELLKFMIPYCYEHTASLVRSQCFIRKAWWVEHKDALGRNTVDILDSLTPKRKPGLSGPAESLDEFDIPQALPDELLRKVSSCVDLMA